MATTTPENLGKVVSKETVNGTLTTNQNAVKRIHVVKYVVMTVSIFLVFPMLVYWVATPDAPIHREFLCVDASQSGVNMFKSTSANECKQVVTLQATLQGVRHSPGLDSVFGEFKKSDVAPSPRYTPYANDIDGASICDVFGGDGTATSPSSPSRRTCMNHKAIRAALVAVFVLMIIAALGTFYMCRVTEGELLRREAAQKNPEISLTLDNLEAFMGWRGTVGLVWGCLLAAAVLWQIQIYDKLYDGPTGGQGSFPSGAGVNFGYVLQYGDSHSMGGVAFGAGLTKLLQVYLWALFSIFTAKVYVNRRFRLKVAGAQVIGGNIGGGVVFGMAPQVMSGVSVELAPTNKMPQLTVDPHKLNTHNHLMQKSMA